MIKDWIKINPCPAIRPMKQALGDSLFFIWIVPGRFDYSFL